MAKKGELAALSSVKTFNDLARRAAAKGSETLSLIWKAGEVAKQAKANVPHGEWMSFVEQHYDVNHSTVCRWIKFHSDIPEAKLCTVQNLTAGIKMLDPPQDTPRTGVAPACVADDQEPASQTTHVDSETWAEGTFGEDDTDERATVGQERNGRPSRKDTDKPVVIDEPDPTWQANEVIKQWTSTIGRWLAPIDDYAEKWPKAPAGAVQKAAGDLYEALKKWRVK